MRSLLRSQWAEHKNAIEALGKDYPASVEVLEAKISDIDDLMDDLDDQEELLTGIPTWMNYDGLLDGWDGRDETFDSVRAANRLKREQEAA